MLKYKHIYTISCYMSSEGLFYNRKLNKQKKMKQIICPVSNEKVNENVVRLTALWIVLILGVFLLIQSPVIPFLLAIDFYIRAFTRLKSSPLSWVSKQLVKIIPLEKNLIDKAPKIFAARIGFVFSVAILLFSLFSLTVLTITTTFVLVLFAFLECGLNFCAGCWVYTYLVLPLYKE